MQKLAKVSSKGQVVIPSKMRRHLKISETVLITEKDGKIILEPSVPMELAFGTGGKKMHPVAMEISLDRRKEVESQRKKLSI
jgi:AbrB family looped-hinge helix DNA binding protein